MVFEDPVKYNAINLITIRTTKDVLQEYKKYIKFGVNDSLLDVGCGPGNVTYDVLLPAIPHPDFRLLGVDISEKVIKFARNYVKDSRVSFRVVDMAENEDILRSKFTEEELNPGFDKIFSFSCIQWTSDYKQCLKNIFSLLKPGGQALVWLIGYFTIAEIWADMYKKEKWMTYLKNVPEFKFCFHDSTDVTSEGTDLLQSIGFQDVICASKHFVQDGEITPTRLTMECIDPYLHIIPEHLRSEYLNDVMELLGEYLERPNKLLCDRIVLIGTKPKKGNFRT